MVSTRQSPTEIARRLNGMCPLARVVLVLRSDMARFASPRPKQCCADRIRGASDQPLIRPGLPDRIEGPDLMIRSLRISLALVALVVFSLALGRFTNSFPYNFFE